MSDTEADAAEEEIDLDDDFEPEKKKFSGKKIVLFFVLPILLLVGGGSGLVFSGIFGGGEEEKKVAATKAHAEGEGPQVPAKTVFFDLPEMLVNLNSSGRRPNRSCGARPEAKVTCWPLAASRPRK